MARGSNTETLAETPISRSLTHLCVGEIWESKDAQRVSIEGAVDGWGHLCVMIRDELGLKFIEPKVLQREYTRVKTAPAGADKISLFKKAFVASGSFEISPEDPAPMTQRQSAYLHSLCAQAGIPFDPDMDRKAGSDEITRIKNLLEG